LKLKRKTVVRKLKESAYVAEEEECIEAATKLVTREIKRKKPEDDVALQKALKIAKKIEVPASNLVRANAFTDAQEVVKATEAVQELVTSDAGNMLMVVNASEGVQEDNTAGSDAAAPEAVTGIPDSPHSLSFIKV
jgi:galactose mutarotase-like enzyme